MNRVDSEQIDKGVDKMIEKQINRPRKANRKDIYHMLDVIGSYKEGKWDKPYAKKYYDEFFEYPELFKDDEVYVVEEDNKIVGVIGYSIDKYESENYWLGWFYTHSDYRRRGFAEHLFRFVEEQLKKLNKDLEERVCFKNAGLHHVDADGLFGGKFLR